MKIVLLFCFLLLSPNVANSQTSGARSGTVVFKKAQTCNEAFAIFSGSSLVPRCRFGDPKPKKAYTVSMIGAMAGTGFDRIRKLPQVQSFAPDTKKSKL